MRLVLCCLILSCVAFAFAFAFALAFAFAFGFWLRVGLCIRFCFCFACAFALTFYVCLAFACLHFVYRQGGKIMRDLGARRGILRRSNRRGCRLLDSSAKHHDISVVDMITKRPTAR